MTCYNSFGPEFHQWKAVRVSDELAGKNLSGHVHSAFERAVNIKLKCGKLAAVLSPERSLYPRSAVLAENYSFTGINPGSPAVIDISAADIVSLAMPAQNAIDSLTYEKRISILFSCIKNAENAAEGLAPLICSGLEHNVWSKFLSKRIQKLQEILRRRDFSACPEIGRSIAGCGPGLTPSSDDFLVGLFAALYAALERDAAAGLCQGLTEGAIPATAAISAGFLESGANGYFCEDVLSLISAFFSPRDNNNLPGIVQQLCLLGATSGVDTITGFCFGLKSVR